jgi:hypothetical protein
MKRLLLGTALSALATAAFAADVPVPVYKAAPAAAVSANGWYLSVDGAWQRVSLPDYALGFHRLAPGAIDAGPMQTFRQRFDGSLVRGAAGYFLPGASLLGANARVEIGGRYGRASGTGTGVVTSTTGAATSLLLDASVPAAVPTCTAGQICATSSNLSTQYSSWQLHGKFAGDYRLGAVTVTPSLAGFGGNARTNQALGQVLTLNNGLPATYNANTTLRWTDVGARAGLDLKVDITPWAALGFSGWAGLARRHTSFSGTDAMAGGFFVLPDASTLFTKASATPFLANAEAGVAFKWIPALVVRGFVGLDYDSKVPGIAAPRVVGPFALPSSGRPAGILFASQTSYYAGGGVTWAFNAPVP